MEEKTWKKLGTDTQEGVNGGVIISDEEYAGACRVTLEVHPGHHTITCGIYGSIVHTVFCSKNPRGRYEEIKDLFKSLIDSNPDGQAMATFCEAFVNRF